jgi:hypothetical protein
MLAGLPSDSFIWIMTNYAISKKKPATTYAEDEKRAIKKRKQARKKVLEGVWKRRAEILRRLFQ